MCLSVNRASLGQQKRGAGVEQLSFHFALPAPLFVKVATSLVEDLLYWRFFIAFYGVAGVLWMASTGLFRWHFDLPFAEASVAGMVGIWTNSGYMGVPLLITAIGPEAALPAVLALTFDNLITVPLLIMILEAKSGTAASPLATLRTVLANLGRNPLIFAVFAWSLGGLDLPTPVARFSDLLVAAAVSCALFAQGASLVGARAEIAAAKAIKLLVHPLLMAATVLWLVLLRADLAIATIVTASLPTEASLFVLAERHSTYTRRASSIVLATHAISVVTVTIVLIWAQS